MATTMEATWYNTIWTWLCERAKIYAQSIWDQVRRFFSSLYEETFKIFEKVGICGQYKDKKQMDVTEDSIKEGKEYFQSGLNFFTKLDDIYKGHKQHNNQQKTEKELNELMQDPDTKKVRDILERQHMVNKTLA